MGMMGGTAGTLTLVKRSGRVLRRAARCSWPTLERMLVGRLGAALGGGWVPGAGAAPVGAGGTWARAGSWAGWVDAIFPCGRAIGADVLE